MFADPTLSTSTPTFCIVSTDPQAAKVVDQLQECGFSLKDISVVLPRSVQTEEINEPKSSIVENTVTGMGTGTFLGLALGWLAGSGNLASLKLFSLLAAAGPVAGTLIGAALGMAFGGIIGILIGVGFQEYFIKRHAELIKKSSIFVAVNTRTTEQINRARKVFKDSYKHEAFSESQVHA